MCCFSGRVQEVSGTRIFARSPGKDLQILAYSMSVSADADLAMILPLPVPPSPPEDAVRFIDLSGYPTLFDDLEKAFPQSRAVPQSKAASKGAAAKSLVVHEVGDFEASFIPRLADFERLDPRFQLPKQVWDKLPDYKDYGFAVFKLRGGEAGRSKAKTIHPMAFEFPIRRESKNLPQATAPLLPDGTRSRRRGAPDGGLRSRALLPGQRPRARGLGSSPWPRSSTWRGPRG